MAGPIPATCMRGVMRHFSYAQCSECHPSCPPCARWRVLLAIFAMRKVASVTPHVRHVQGDKCHPPCPPCARWRVSPSCLSCARWRVSPVMSAMRKVSAAPLRPLQGSAHQALTAQNTTIVYLIHLQHD